jgi:regulator of protease activity HflC (stomatin/prohibitin superfamily)
MNLMLEAEGQAETEVEVAAGQAEVLVEEQEEEAANGKTEMHNWIFVYVVILFNLIMTIIAYFFSNLCFVFYIKDFSEGVY